MPATIITGPAAEPVSLEEARKHCRIDSDQTEHDWLLTLLIQMAREQAEAETGRAFINRTVRLTECATACLQLRPCPVVSVSEVKLIADDESETTLAPEAYRISTTRIIPRLVIADGVGGARDMQVTMIAGYGATAASVPAAVRRWMLLYISTHFENRETIVQGTSVNALPMGFADGLLDTVRLHPGF